MLRNERGFTVIEMLVVLVLIGLLVVVQLSGMQGYQNQRNTKQAARLLAGDIRLTQQYAITNDENYQLLLVGGNPVYRIVKVSDSSVAKEVAIPDGVTMTSTFASDTVTFTPTGAPTASGKFCVTGTSTILAVLVKPATGRAEIAEEPACP